MEAKLLRAKARASLQGNWGISIGAAAVACLLGGMIVGTSFLPDVSTVTESGSHVMELFGRKVEITESLRIGFSGSFLAFVGFILGGVIELGYSKFLLAQHDGRPFEFNDLFSQFDRFGTGFAQSFLRNLYVALWSLLLIVPGIIKSLSYSMTPFILAENPDMTASEAINRSKEMMDGHKMELFILGLSFIGWTLLAALTLNLGYLALNPYTNAAYAAFYRQLQAEPAIYIE